MSLSPLFLRPRIHLILLEVAGCQLFALLLLAVAVAGAKYSGPVLLSAQLGLAAILSGYGALRAAAAQPLAIRLDAIRRGRQELEFVRIETAAHTIVEELMGGQLLAPLTAPSPLLVSESITQGDVMTSPSHASVPTSVTDMGAEALSGNASGNASGEISGIAALAEGAIAAFANYGHVVQVLQSIRGPSFVRLLLEMAPGTKPADLRPCLEGLQVALRLPQQPVLAIESGRLCLDIPLQAEHRVFFDLDQLPAHEGVPLGVDIEGNLIAMKFGDRVPSVLIAGCPGSGKTSLMATWTESLLRQGEACCIADGKGSGHWLDYAGDVRLMSFNAGGLSGENEGLFRVANSQELALIMTSWLVAERDRRAKKRVTSPRIHFFADELPELFRGDIGKEVEAHFSALCRLGREAGIHVIGGLQHPTAQALGTQIRGSMGGRLALQCVEATAATVMGMPGLSLGQLSAQGDCYWLAPGCQSVRLQAPYCSSPLHELDGTGVPAMGDQEQAERRRQLVGWGLGLYREGKLKTLRDVARLVLTHFYDEGLLAKPDSEDDREALMDHMEEVLGKS